MKRYLTLICLCMFMAFGLCGCSSAASSAEADLPELVIGASIYEPYFYLDINGPYAGIDADIMREACRRMGYQPVIKGLDLDRRFVSLEAGNVDCIWTGLTMEGRETAFDWAGPYLYTRRVVVVPEDSSIETLADLEGKRMSVQTGSTTESILLSCQNPVFPELRQLTSFPELGEVFTALRNGYVDAASGMEAGLQVYLDEHPGQYRFLNMSIRSQALGVAFKKGSHSDLAAELSNIFTEMKEDGTIQAILESYGLDPETNMYGGIDHVTAQAQ